MKRVIMFIVVSIMLFTTVKSQAQVTGFVEYESIQTSNVPATVTTNIYLHGNRGLISWSLWALEGKYWSEVYAGPTYSPFSWMEIGLGIGFESNSSVQRFGSTLWIGKGIVSDLFTYEKGENGDWYKNIVTIDINKQIAIGLFSQKFLGNGPYVQIKAGSFTFWGTIVKDVQTYNAFGIRYNF